MTYAGEHTAAGNTGHLFIILSFVLAALSGISYFLATRNEEDRKTWIRYGRIFFFGHVASSLVFMGIVLFMLLNHYYEFEYIWEQSSEDMSFRYLLVCFWGGQEGSFMLWIFWHLVLGSILIFTSKKYEAHIMTIFCLVQVFLVSMLLGVYIGDFKLGSSPFALRRQTNEVFGALWNFIPDYFTFDTNMQSGRGLNPLLRNYWMTIHPPTLFLGFGLTLVPFCYAVAGIWTRQLKEWIKPAIPWTFLGVMVLGGGILMGGRWAYESLSFGGFWAWDPVENASLVPWIFLLGAGHLMIINRNNAHSLFSTFLLTLFSFVFIVLSTFLTRSGILGETSVHSFTGEDMMGQLLLYLMFFTWFSVHLLLFNKKLKWIFGIFSLGIFLATLFIPADAFNIPLLGMEITIKSVLNTLGFVGLFVFLVVGYTKHFPVSGTTEEHFSAREFWMFIASVVLAMSAFHIIVNTALPAINEIYGTKRVILIEERNETYNQYQIPFAIIITLIMGFAQFMKYRKTDPQRLLKDLLIAGGITFILSGLLAVVFGMKLVRENILLFASVFAIIANLDYYLRIMKGKLNQFGSSIAHVGFGMVVLGSLVSQANQKIISQNLNGYELAFMGEDSDMSNEEDIQLFKGELTSMGDYFVVFKNKRLVEDPTAELHYDIDYIERLPLTYKKGDRVRYNFVLYECNADHPAQKNFMQEVNFWKPIDAQSSAEFFSYPNWESARPGKVLFTLSPFVQLNNRMGNTAEPGTQNFWSHDIFTHIKQADVSPISNGKMPGFKFSGKLGDTLWTAGYRIILEDIYKTAAHDSTHGNLAARIQMRVLHNRDMLGAHPFIITPSFEIDSAGNTISPVTEIKALGLEFRLTGIDPGTTDPSQPMSDRTARFEIDFVTPEYIVMHATRFPFIIILWWGCIIMCLGTFMAVIFRIRQNRKVI